MKLQSINWGIVYGSRKTLAGEGTQVVGLNESFSKSSGASISHALPKPPISTYNGELAGVKRLDLEQREEGWWNI